MSHFHVCSLFAACQNAAKANAAPAYAMRCLVLPVCVCRAMRVRGRACRHPTTRLASRCARVSGARGALLLIRKKPTRSFGSSTRIFAPGVSIHLKLDGERVFTETALRRSPKN